MKTIKFDITGMHCSSCAMNIDFDLEDLKGIKSSKTNYAKQICEVEFDEKELQTQDIIKQINETGYQAQLVK